MSDPEKFLTRWSRRKREVEQHEGPAPPERAAIDPASEALPPEATEITPSTMGEETLGQVQPFDPASLPAIESITAETDIRGYFAPGVPSELARAALRRVWSADPAIRDFVGFAENAWDFNAPETIPGFGPITAADDVAGMMRQMLGQAQEAVQQTGPEAQQKALKLAESPDRPTEQREATERRVDATPEFVAAPESLEQSTSRAKQEPACDEPPPASEPIRTAGVEPVARRAHGSALPK
jgi:hypothetical protein